MSASLDLREVVQATVTDLDLIADDLQWLCDQSGNADRVRRVAAVLRANLQGDEPECAGTPMQQIGTRA